MKSRIFSVEDDENIQNVVKIALTNSGYTVDCFREASSFFAALEDETPDLVLLDIMLPDIDGYSIVERLKASLRWNRIPLLILSAKSSELNKVIGLDLGADDYMTKPFGILELISRVKALLRRNQDVETNVMTSGDLILFPDERICEYHSHKIAMTEKEFALMHLLIEHANKAVSREEIMNSIWGYDFMGETRTIDVHIQSLRKKLLEIGMKENVLQSVRGVGYKFVL